MRKCYWLSAIGLSLLCVLSFSAQAKVIRSMPFLFGESDALYPIEPRTFVRYQGSDMLLGYRISKHWFIFGVGLTDRGYVLIHPYAADRYYPLPLAELKRLQQRAVLPKHMPRYDIRLSDYLSAYSLWLLLSAIAGAIFYFWRPLLKR